MRLIDAGKLKENCKITGEFKNNFQCVDLVTLGCVIDNQPTAYDVDKVVAELEKQSEVMCGMYRNVECPYSRNREVSCEKCAMLRAIQIVKGGGVDGEVPA